MPRIWWFWPAVAAALAFRLLLLPFANELNLGSRPEVATPLTSLRRLAEGYWLKQSSLSPYAGSMYHGSPLLLIIFGPLTAKRVESQPAADLYCSLIFVFVDFLTSMLIRAIGQKLGLTNYKILKFLKPSELDESSGGLEAADIACLIYLWNPFTIMTCLGSCTSPIDNLMVVLAIYGACSRVVPLAAFGWVMATHLSLYPAILLIPVLLLLVYGPDAPPPKLFVKEHSNAAGSFVRAFSWKPILQFALWALIWSCYILLLSCIYLKGFDGAYEMLKKTFGFILTVEDLSPNIGVLWYFFAEVFDFFRDFFLIVFHVNILFMVCPLAIRLMHRPCFLAFIYITVSSVLKSYPSVGDAALYLSLLGLFVVELAEMKFSFFLFCGYVGVSLLSPVMHNLWIWRGTGNANFYFATGLAYACLQTVLVVEVVSTMLNHDRMLKKKLKKT
ncbi:phosphatidylinositol glycan anchor biosynthesis class U protein-like [Phalaenopsis equestris]|uniref:phosphatidylinositol glycan anchor biosynthesis class U protein-like n=1 Tax=Phalaenopsis equestris TaxID=78828 RepID=UPI0009E26E38|nr:phosphatidylinositol glycan anchor biosynthesis class U protein-like [Phalaenopsis equestris]